MRGRWLSRKAILAHLVVLAAVTFCLLAGWWQLDRARSGNALSWAYAVQWPIFAGVAGVMWWQLIHHMSGETGTEPEAEAEPHLARQRRREAEDPALREYNDELEFLSAFGGRKSWRNPTGRP